MAPTERGDVFVVFARPEDIPWMVSTCAVDLGITGYDYVLESGAEVEVLEDLGFGRARVVVAVPAESRAERPEDLEGARVATKYVNLARRFFESLGVRVRVFRVSGAAEVMPRLGVADAIVDVTSTGTTLALHGLRPIATVLETSARLVACPGRERRGRVAEVVESLRAVVRGRRHRLLLMNVPDDALEAVLSALPSMAGPMVARIESGEPMWEVMTAVPEQEVWRVVSEARRRGARDIVVLRVERVVP